MTNGKKAFKPRKHERFLALTGMYAALRPDYVKVGQIRDISVAGLAFEYIGAKKESPDELRALDILMLDGGFYLNNLPCRIVSDVIAYKGPEGLSATMRRCGIQFRELTAYQSGRLEFFIRQHIMPEKQA